MTPDAVQAPVDRPMVLIGPGSDSVSPDWASSKDAGDSDSDDSDGNGSGDGGKTANHGAQPQGGAD